MTKYIAGSSDIVDCTICDTIWRGFAHPAAVHTLKLGSLRDVRSSQCPTHMPLLEAFIEFCIKNGSEPDDLGIEIGKGSSVKLMESISTGGSQWPVVLVKTDSVPDHIGIGRILDPDWADIELVKHWKQRCLSCHGAACESPMKIWETRPAWVIDIQQKCLVPGKDCPGFVALSYRWGRGAGLRVDVETVGNFLKPRVLDSPEIAERLPPIIRDVIYLTSMLNERYLWVDALCIVHGDIDATATELNLMGAIYASAIVTVIAADGDSVDGLRGLRGVSVPRELEQWIFPFGQDKVVVRNTGKFMLTGGTPYYDRGWTYQEHKMARRKILFNKKELHWECQCSVWHEELTLGAEVDMYIDQGLTMILAGFPDMKSFSQIMCNYNVRQLHYDEDALPGIMGLLSIFSRTFIGGFLYGLPEMLFDKAVGWEPASSFMDLRRRTESNRPENLRLSDSTLPSWSWIGWEGLVSIGQGESMRVNYWTGDIEETIPITEWYTSASPTGFPRRRIRSTWFESRDTFKDFTKPLPAGWSRHDVPVHEQTKDEPYLYPDGCGEYIFKHAKMPNIGVENDSWYYPFPVADIDESSPPYTPEQTPYICCQTKKARLYVRKTDDYNNVELCNASGVGVGSLYLHNRDQLQTLFSGNGTENSQKTVELVAIYRSRIYEKTWEEYLTQFGDPRSISEKYQVLWVEWKEKVAYRLAVGCVEKEHWEALELEDVSLVLG